MLWTTFLLFHLVQHYSVTPVTVGIYVLLEATQHNATLAVEFLQDGRLLVALKCLTLCRDRVRSSVVKLTNHYWLRSCDPRNSAMMG